MNFNYDSYRRNGFAELGQIITEDEIDSVTSFFRQIEQLDQIPNSYEANFEEPEVTNSSSESTQRRLRKLRRLIWNRPDLFAPILCRSGIIDLAERMLGPEAAIVFHAAFLKPAQIGTHVGLHQDQALWSREYPGAFSVWVALTDVNLSNGGLAGRPGTHNHELTHHPDPEHPWHPTLAHMEAELPEERQFNLRPGDAVMWDRWFAHSSGANTSEHDRQGMVVVLTLPPPNFSPADCMFLSEVRTYAKGSRA